MQTPKSPQSPEIEPETLSIHAYGGNLLATPRSTWHPETHEETQFDWRKVASE